MTDKLPDEVLLALGHLVWAAINLEDVVYDICHTVKPELGVYHVEAIGWRIDEAVTFVPFNPKDEGAIDPVLVHFPRDRNHPVVNTPLTVDGLERIRRRLEAARIGWLDLAADLSERRFRLP